MAGKKPITSASKAKSVTKGGPEGAKEGGASRGASRLEPSHQKQARKADKGIGGKKKPAK